MRIATRFIAGSATPTTRQPPHTDIEGPLTISFVFFHQGESAKMQEYSKVAHSTGGVESR